MPQEGSVEMRNRVVAVHKIQVKRIEEARDVTSDLSVPHSNSEMSSRDIRKFCKLDRRSAELLKKAMNSLGFSARAYDRILNVARTIADLEKMADVQAIISLRRYSIGVWIVRIERGRFGS